jgi:DNA-binding transcriptional LysR family regulator
MASITKLVRYRAITYFDAVRRYGSIREAARRLNVAASAVNRQLLRFEEDAGLPLFERMTDGMKLTAAGEVFARHVITVLQDEKRAASELDALRGLRRGELSLIGVESLNATVLPALIGLMAERYPGVRLSVLTAGSNTIPSAVVSGGADIGLAFSLSQNDELQQLGSGRFGLGAVMRSDHPLAQEKQVTFSACALYPLILPTPQLSTHTVLAPQLACCAGNLAVAAEVESMELMRNLTLRLGAISFQVRLGIEEELRTRKLVYVPLQAAGPVTTDLGIYMRRGRSVSAALDAFLTLAREYLAELAEGDLDAHHQVESFNNSRAALPK